MPKIAIVSMRELENWQSSDYYGYNTERIVEHISEWDDVTEEELSLLRSYASRTKLFQQRKYTLLVKEDYEKLREPLMADIKTIIAKERQLKAEETKRKAEEKAKKDAAAARKALKRREELKKEAEALGLKVMDEKDDPNYKMRDKRTGKVVQG